jgi:hypothetical protein
MPLQNSSKKSNKKKENENISLLEFEANTSGYSSVHLLTDEDLMKAYFNAIKVTDNNDFKESLRLTNEYYQLVSLPANKSFLARKSEEYDEKQKVANLRRELNDRLDEGEDKSFEKQLEIHEDIQKRAPTGTLFYNKIFAKANLLRHKINAKINDSRKLKTYQEDINALTKEDVEGKIQRTKRCLKEIQTEDIKESLLSYIEDLEMELYFSGGSKEQDNSPQPSGQSNSQTFGLESSAIGALNTTVIPNELLTLLSEMNNNINNKLMEVTQRIEKIETTISPTTGSTTMTTSSHTTGITHSAVNTQHSHIPAFNATNTSMLYSSIHNSGTTAISITPTTHTSTFSTCIPTVTSNAPSTANASNPTASPSQLDVNLILGNALARLAMSSNTSITQQTPSIKSYVKRPTPWKGGNSSELRAWIRGFENTCKGNGWPEDIWLRECGKAFEGSAEAIFGNQIGYESRLTWEEAKETLIRFYGGNTESFTSLWTLNNTKRWQFKTAGDYVARMVEISQIIDPYFGEQTLVNTICNNLEPKVRSRVLNGGMPSMDNILQRITDAEASYEAGMPYKERLERQQKFAKGQNPSEKRRSSYSSRNENESHSSYWNRSSNNQNRNTNSNSNQTPSCRQNYNSYQSQSQNEFNSKNRPQQSVNYIQSRDNNSNRSRGSGRGGGRGQRFNQSSNNNSRRNLFNSSHPNHSRNQDNRELHDNQSATVAATRTFENENNASNTTNTHEQLINAFRSFLATNANSTTNSENARNASN